MSGLTPQGFVSKSVEEVRQELIDKLRADISPSLDFGADSVLGHIVGIVSEFIAGQWDQMQAVYRSAYPDSATGDALDGIAAITGVTRLPASPSRVVATVTGDEGTVLPAGRVASVEGTGARFRTLEEVTIPASGSIDVEMVSEELGPIPAPTGTLAEIETPVVGWESVTNAADAILGRRRETDEELRIRREDTLRSIGSGTFEALRAGLLLVPNVQQVRLFENTTMGTVDGMPPKSFEAVVQGGEDESLWAEVWRLKPAGIQAHGSVVGEVEDSQGATHEVAFSRPDAVNVYLKITVKRTSRYPTDGAERIRAALIERGQDMEIGEDVIASRLYPLIYSATPGIEDITELHLGTAPNPSGSDNVVIPDRSLAVFDSERILVEEI